MVKEIAIGMLVPHAEACNYMAKEGLLKLRRSIEFTGLYEPLIVRPYAQVPGKYQIIHGHNRLRVLKAMGHETVKCVQWDLDDEQTRVYLAVMNRVSGSDIPERRALLLEQLLQHMTIDELAALVPDKKRVLDELEKLSKLEIDDLASAPTEQANESTAPVIINCMIESAGAKSVDLALDLIVEASGGQMSRGQAMVELARRFIRQCVSSQHMSGECDEQIALDSSCQAVSFLPPSMQQRDSNSISSRSASSRITKRQPVKVRAR